MLACDSTPSILLQQGLSILSCNACARLHHMLSRSITINEWDCFSFFMFLQDLLRCLDMKPSKSDEADIRVELGQVPACQLACQL